MKQLGSLKSYVFILVFALLAATNYEIFILNNAFAPAGINGIATMIQYKLGISVGYLNLLFNIPLCLIALFFVEKKFIAKSMTFTLAFSAFLLLFRNGVLNLSPFVYVTENGTSTILAPIAAGVLNGMLFTSVIKTGGSMGGMDIVAACIRKVKPHLNMNSVIFTLNTCVAMVSYFVYDFNVEPVILCIMYCFISSQMSEKLMQGVKRAVKFEIVSNHYEEISKEIIEDLHHSVTVMPATGMYTHKETKLMVCVVTKREVHNVQEILAKYPGTFAYTSNVTETMGNFMRQRTVV
jgi:uncharacterized membrane-anchored protein YitT (DUF2179 family)